MFQSDMAVAIQHFGFGFRGLARGRRAALVSASGFGLVGLVSGEW